MEWRIRRAANFLAHYASPYYDPQKAHDYYERTKVLADKNAKSALTSKEQRDTYAVVKDSISTARKAEATTTQTAETERVKALQATAKAAADRITADLKALAQKVKNDLAVVKLNPIPENASPEVRRYLEKQNKLLRAKAVVDSKTKVGQASSQAQADLKKVGSDLGAAIQDARNSYSQAMLALNAKYNTALTTEKQNIHDQVAASVAKTAAKKAPAKKAKASKSYPAADNSAW